MDVQVKYHSMKGREDLSDHIERRLSLALDRFERSIRNVVMHVYDMNGPRGGFDKRCLALVHLKQGNSLAYELRDANLFSAVDRMADRLKERLRRELERRRWRRMEDKKRFSKIT